MFRAGGVEVMSGRPHDARSAWHPAGARPRAPLSDGGLTCSARDLFLVCSFLPPLHPFTTRRPDWRGEDDPPASNPDPRVRPQRRPPVPHSPVLSPTLFVLRPRSSARHPVPLPLPPTSIPAFEWRRSTPHTSPPPSPPPRSTRKSRHPPQPPLRRAPRRARRACASRSRRGSTGGARARRSGSWVRRVGVVTSSRSAMCN